MSSFANYVNKAHVFFLQNRKTLRRGQCYFNTLVEVKPELAECIRGTDLDPFYHEHRFERFFSYVHDNWSAY